MLAIAKNNLIAFRIIFSISAKKQNLQIKDILQLIYSHHIIQSVYSSLIQLFSTIMIIGNNILLWLNINISACFFLMNFTRADLGHQ